MASPRTRSVMKDLKLKDGNSTCFECGGLSPQWVSVSYGKHGTDDGRQHLYECFA